MAKNPPGMWFVPSETILHPETREVLMSPDTAYSLWRLSVLYRESGIDNCQGEVVTLEVARQYRKENRITGFQLMSVEE
jgi:hypothetical protein